MKKKIIVPAFSLHVLTAHSVHLTEKFSKKSNFNLSLQNGVLWFSLTRDLQGYLKVKFVFKREHILIAKK